MGVPASFRHDLNGFHVLTLLLAVLIRLPGPLYAQVATDGTVGPAQAPITSLLTDIVMNYKSTQGFEVDPELQK